MGRLVIMLSPHALLPSFPGILSNTASLFPFSQPEFFLVKIHACMSSMGAIRALEKLPCSKKMLSFLASWQDILYLKAKRKVENEIWAPSLSLFDASLCPICLLRGCGILFLLLGIEFHQKMLLIESSQLARGFPFSTLIFSCMRKDARKIFKNSEFCLFCSKEKNMFGTGSRTNLSSYDLLLRV